MASSSYIFEINNLEDGELQLLGITEIDDDFYLDCPESTDVIEDEDEVDQRIVEQKMNGLALDDHQIQNEDSVEFEEYYACLLNRTETETMLNIEFKTVSKEFIEGMHGKLANKGLLEKFLKLKQLIEISGFELDINYAEFTV